MKTRGLALLLTLAMSGCDSKPKEEDRGPAPPPAASGKPGACAKGGGKPTDQVTAGYFPRVSGDYCLDPNGETRAYGEEAKESIDKVCTEQFDGECEVYKRYGLKRVVTMRYVDGKGSPGTVSVTLSRFANVEGAYGFFTKRVIADADPAETKPKALAAGAAAQLGGSNANVWRGEYMLELAYNNEREAPDAMRATTAKVLPPLAKTIGDKLPGAKKLPPAAVSLPKENRIDLGVSYETQDALDVGGVGPGALGFYRKDKQRWRVLSLVRGDEDSAKDVLKTFRKIDGARAVKEVTFDAVTFSLQDDEDSPRIDWVVGRQGTRVFGVGDEENVLSADQSAEEAAPLRLAPEAKLESLKKLVEK